MILKVENLEVSYGDLQIIWGINFYVNENEIVAILGKNGAGKSTILSAISGILPVKNGKIFFKGEDITLLSPQERVKRGIIYVPEGAEVFPEMSVYDNLLMGAYHIKSKKKREDLLEMVFSIFPILKERLDQSSGTLSGGERQMLSIARALMADPKLVLLDEPSLGLQPSFVNKIFNTIASLKKLGKTVLFVEQQIFQSLKIANRAYIVENGKILLEGKSDNLLKNNNLVKIIQHG